MPEYTFKKTTPAPGWVEIRIVTTGSALHSPDIERNGLYEVRAELANFCLSFSVALCQRFLRPGLGALLAKLREDILKESPMKSDEN